MIVAKSAQQQLSDTPRFRGPACGNCRHTRTHTHTPPDELYQSTGKAELRFCDGNIRRNVDEALEAHMRYTLRKELRQKHTRAVPIGRLVDFKGSVNFRLQVSRALHRRDRRGVSFPWFCLLDHVEMCDVGQLDKLGWRLFTS